MKVRKIAGLLGGVFCILALLTSPVYAAATLSSNNIQVNESENVATFTFTLSEPAEEDVNIYYRTVEGSATAPEDYTAAPNNSYFTIQGGNDSATVNVPLHPDIIDEPNEFFRLELIEYPQVVQPTSNSWTATIIDNDDSPAPVIAAPSTTTPARPITPPDTPVSSTSPIQPENPQPKPAKVLDNNLLVVQEQLDEGAPPRSAFVRSLRDPSQIDWSPAALVGSLLLAIFLVLLIAFPAELFNGTLQSNYDEISGWFKNSRLSRFTKLLHARVPVIISLFLFTLTGALINSLLSPDFGFNQATLALLLGMFITILISSFIFDVARCWYMNGRFKINSRLRTHSIGLLFAAMLVLAARLLNFLPGYVYGVFTAVVFFGRQPSAKEDGHGLAIFSLVLLAVAAGGWFAWIPVKQVALETGASFWVLVADAVLASLWVAALCAIVFGLIPLRFSNGEQVKKWSTKGWVVIYGLGMMLFVHTLFKPDQIIYMHSENTAWSAVLTLFLGFGGFSVLFWGYFRYRHLWRKRTAISKP